MEGLKRILTGWNYPKYAAAVVSIYAVMAAVGNFFFWLFRPEKEKRRTAARKKALIKQAKRLPQKIKDAPELVKEVPELARDAADVMKELPKEQKIFNGVLAACFLVDMTVGYFVVKAVEKRLP